MPNQSQWSLRVSSSHCSYRLEQSNKGSWDQLLRRSLLKHFQYIQLRHPCFRFGENMLISLSFTNSSSAHNIFFQHEWERRPCLLTIEWCCHQHYFFFECSICQERLRSHHDRSREFIQHCNLPLPCWKRNQRRVESERRYFLELFSGLQSISHWVVHHKVLVMILEFGWPEMLGVG